MTGHTYEIIIITRARRHSGMFAMTYDINLINTVVDFHSFARLRVCNHYIWLKTTSDDTRTEDVKCKFYVAPANIIRVKLMDREKII